MTAFEPKEGWRRRRLRSSLKFCPRCGSNDVFWAQGLPQLWSLWQCKNCGYYGAFILENGNLAEKLREKWKAESRPSSSNTQLVGK